jgi:ribonuclease HIII
MGHIGVDESGKGDYFGYLVVAAVYVDEKISDELKKLHVRDSKLLSDSSAMKTAASIRKICKYDVVLISPKKYNSIYSKFKSLNYLLAWGHARAIENLLGKIPSAEYAISDKFGDEKYVKNAMLEKGKKIKLIQMHRAESDIAVAAASIVARAEFLSTLGKLSDEWGMKLPKGAAHVIADGKEFVKMKGENNLQNVAKLHFKTTKDILGKK